MQTDTSSSLAMTLRTRTQEHHTRAEHHPVQQAVARGQIDRATWGRAVAQNRAVHAALEAALDRAAQADPRVGQVFAPHHRRLAKFDADLAALDVLPQDRVPLPTTARVCGWINQLERDQPLALLGVLYVLEGSTNGGQYLARPLARALGLAEGSKAGLTSLDPHGPQTRELWAGFRAAVDGLAVTPAELEAVVAAACRTFDAVGEVLDGVAGTAAAAAAPNSLS